MTAKSQKSVPANLNGAIIIDKPEGLTSHDVVARLRRILRTRKIGHTGTLDPFATGVLVMLIGKATRLARYLEKDKKTYEARLRFGFETETGDKEGKRRRTGDENRGSRVEGRGTGDEGQGEEFGIQESGFSGVEIPSRSELISRVEAVLPEFTGAIRQVPPMFSAKKIKGKKLYELARQGIEVERKPLDVNIYELRLVDGGPGDESEICLRVTCSAGTYIRTLAEDIGRRIGVGCHLSALRRTKAGTFDIGNALTIEELETVAGEERTNEYLVPMNRIVEQLPYQELDENETKLISHGMKIDARIDAGSVQNIRLTDVADELVAIGETDGEGSIQPKVVFISE